MILVTIDGTYTYTTRYYTSHITIAHIGSSQSATVFASRCLVAASNSGRSPSSEFPNCPRARLPISHTNSSQLLSLSSALSHSLTHQPTHSSLIVWLLTNWLTNCNKVNVKIRTTLRLAVYRCSVRLAVKHLEDHDQTFFSPNEHLRSYSLCNILSDEKMGLSLMNMLDLLPSVRIAHIAFYWKFFLVPYIQVLCQYRFCRADHAYLTYLMLQRHLSHLNGG
jgi:hypothetical protein